MFSERTQVLLSPEQVEKVKRIAAREGRSVGAVIRDAVDTYVDPDARDLAYVATCIHEGIPAIVSVDREFHKAAEVRRIDPSEFAA